MNWWTIGIRAGVVLAALWGFFAGVRIVRPTHRGLVELLGRYRRMAEPGFHWLIPLVERMVPVNITEQMVDAKKQVVITKDSLNAQVDAQVYFKVKSDEDSVKASQYAVAHYDWQIVSLARTTMRNIIGTMTLKEANSERGRINAALYETLAKEAASWGIEIVRTELKEIDPPEDVQNAMNNVVKAEQQKIAAKDLAEAAEMQADGLRRAAIKQAEGVRQADILEAEGKAQAIALVAIAQREHFKEAALLYRQLEVVERSLAANVKIVLPEGKALVNVIGDLAGLAPWPDSRVSTPA